MQHLTPWPHFLFDNFLSEEIFSNLQTLLAQHKANFHQDDDDEMKINYKFLPDLELAKYFLSQEFKLFLEKTTGLSLTLNQKSLVQLRMMHSESPAMPPHIDNQEQKSLVCILYVSPNWKKGNGGELCLLTDQTDTPFSQKSKIIEPVSNRMVMFLSEDSHWHSVMSVNNWTRYSIIMEWLIN